MTGSRATSMDQSRRPSAFKGLRREDPPRLRSLLGRRSGHRGGQGRVRLGGWSGGRGKIADHLAVDMPDSDAAPRLGDTGRQRAATFASSSLLLASAVAVAPGRKMGDTARW